MLSYLGNRTQRPYFLVLREVKQKYGQSVGGIIELLR